MTDFGQIFLIHKVSKPQNSFALILLEYVYNLYFYSILVGSPSGSYNNTVYTHKLKYSDTLF